MKRWIASLALVMTASAAFAADWEYPQTTASATSDAASVVITQQPAYFSITRADVEKAVAEQLRLQGVETKIVKANADPSVPTQLYAADHPLKLSLQALQIDKTSRRWQAQAYMIADQNTEAMRPVSGRYETLVTVPVLTKQLSASDVIEASDLTTRNIPERFLRKDTVTTAAAIIGKAPVRMISPERPIRVHEVALPTVVKKGQAVEMTYTTAHVHIRDQGEALEDGATGDMIRVKNSKTGRAVNARVVGNGRVETNPEQVM